VRAVSVTPASATLRVGEQQPLSVVVDAINGAATTVTWTSESPAVATVSTSGVVTALGVGTAVIRATSTANASVSGTTVMTIQTARNLTVSPTMVSIGVGQTAPLTATLQLEAGLPTGVTWRTSAATIASVSATGVVTGVALGTATITAVSIADTTLRATVAATVVASVRAVTVTPTTSTMNIDNTVPLTATVTADPGIAQTVNWRSSNAAVASVSGTGIVTALGLGTSTITVLSTVDTTRRATATITVAARALSVTIAQRNVSVNPGASLTLTATVNADPGVNRQIAWTSSNNAAASISAAGVLTGIAVGNTLITATSVADGSRRDTLTVSVVPRLSATWTPTRLGGVLYEDIVGLATIDATTTFAVNAIGDIFRWNGTAWALSATGASLGTTIYAIHGTAATSVFAVGANGVIARWNGTTWTTMASGTSRALYAVWVENATTAWATGENGVMLRFNGTTWASENAGTTGVLTSVWSGDNVVYAVGVNGGAVRKVAGTWGRIVLPTLETLYAVHGVSASDIVVTGAAGAIVRWNGTAWFVVDAGGLSGNIYAVAGSGLNAGRRFLVGDGGVAQLDGALVTPVATPYAPRLYAAVMLDATGTVWAGGQRGLVMRSGTPWTTLNLAPDLLDVWTASSTSAFAVGEFGSVYRWNGTAWTRQSVPTTVSLQSVWAPNATDAFAGGENGTMLRFNGTSWTTMTIPTTSSIYNIWGTNASNVYAVTSGGDVLRFNGTAWQLVNTAPQALWAIYGASANDIVVAGENGIVQRFNGTTWSTLPAPVRGTLAGLWLTSGNDIYAVGATTAGTNGAAFTFNGTAWNPLQVGSTRVLTSIWGPSVSDLYVTGDGGTLLRYNGNTWTTLTTNTTDLLWSVSSAPGAAVGAFAVGYNGTVLAGSGGGALRTDEQATTTGSLDPHRDATVRRAALPVGAARRTRR
jgi:uncharacterized protein YjdB